MRACAADRAGGCCGCCDRWSALASAAWPYPRGHGQPARSAAGCRNRVLQKAVFLAGAGPKVRSVLDARGAPATRYNGNQQRPPIHALVGIARRTPCAQRQHAYRRSHTGALPPLIWHRHISTCGHRGQAQGVATRHHTAPARQRLLRRRPSAQVAARGALPSTPATTQQPCHAMTRDGCSFDASPGDRMVAARERERPRRVPGFAAQRRPDQRLERSVGVDQRPERLPAAISTLSREAFATPIAGRVDFGGQPGAERADSSRAAGAVDGGADHARRLGASSASARALELRHASAITTLLRAPDGRRSRTTDIFGQTLTDNGPG